MKKKQKISMYALLIIGIFLAFASSCEKDDDNNPASNNPTNGKTTAVFNPDVTYGTMTDQNGNVYKTVTIGLQTWMAENLRATTYNDGSAIPNATDDDVWAGLSTGAYCNYKNTTNLDTIATYGRLYNWHAVNTGKLAPKGWHVPTNAEWNTLSLYLTGDIVAGGKLKETGMTHWTSPNTGATNETGFTALPGGDRGNGGLFNSLGIFGDWWSTSQNTPDIATSFGLGWDYSSSNGYFSHKVCGYSIRCVMD